MQQNETIKARVIWSKQLRLAHWALAFSTLVLMATGWLVKNAPSVASAASDWHYIAGSVFTIALALRIWVLFTDRLLGHIQHLIQNFEPKKVLQMVQFYLSFGKSPLPKWFAHNPLWAPIYLLIFAFMLVMAISGHLQTNIPILFGLYLPEIHSGFATMISVFVLVHVIAVFMHDLKGEGHDISAMINGRRIFTIKPVDVPPQNNNGVYKVSVDSLKSTLKKD